MTASFETPTRTTLRPGDFVQVSKKDVYGEPWGGVGRVCSSPVVPEDGGLYQVTGVSMMGTFTRLFMREDLTRLVPEPEQCTREWCAEDPFDDPVSEFTTREDLVAAFKDYLNLKVGPEDLERRKLVVKGCLDKFGVKRVIDLKPEQRADAIAFVKEQENLAANATSTLRDGRHVDDRSAQGYNPHTLDNDDLQTAIDNALRVLKEGPGFDVDDSRVVRCLLEDHLNDLLEIQRERAGGAP